MKKEPIIIKGKYSDAVIYANLSENGADNAIKQVFATINDKITQNSKVYFMPNMHYAK